VALVERAQAELPLAVQADLVGVSRSSLYYRPLAPSPEEVALKHRIDGIYTRYPFSRYLSFYNDERPHQSLGYKTPAEVYHTTTTNTVGQEGPTPLSLPPQKGDEPTFFSPSFVS